jgi:hypothetical protein
MKLSETEQNFLLKSFPNVELSYETMVHKKVYNSNYVLAIPEGQKCFAWFTTFKTQNVCILLEISENKRISRINVVSACFHQELSYGTIFYGTVFSCKNKRYFSSEDIYYYKGANVSKNAFKDKLTIFKTIFTSEIKQLAYYENNVIFALPIISNSCDELLRTVAILPYKIKHIQFRSDSDVKINNLLHPISDAPVEQTGPKPTYRNDLKREIVFKIKPDIQNDIYHLHYYDNNTTENIFDVAYIPDYKTSVMMNRLFRKIKENANLDALEESDDEEEFEDDRPDKFVFLDKSYNMVCTWNNKFKKWAPIRVAQKGDKIITKKELSYYERK